MTHIPFNRGEAKDVGPCSFALYKDSTTVKKRRTHFNGKRCYSPWVDYINVPFHDTVYAEASPHFVIDTNTFY